MYDTIIIGAGPAGLTAGIYLARGGYKTIILEKDGIGGQIAGSPLVENYPGFISISGAELTNNMYEQVTSLGVEVEIETVKAIQDGETKKVLTEGNTYEAKTVIIATGSKYRTLGLPIEDKFLGNGIHFCVSCDGAFYKNKTVAVIGGGNSAVTNALYLADIAKKVYLIHNLDTLTCEKNLIEKLSNKNNIEIIYQAKVEEFLGEESLSEIKLTKDKEILELSVDGLFESIGMDAQTEVVCKLLELNNQNYIIGENGQTNLPGIFVAGDCRAKEVRQLTTAVSDGTIAAISAMKYINRN